MRNSLLTCLLLVSVFLLPKEMSAQTDATQLTLELFLRAVHEYHPLAKEARLQSRAAKAAMQSAKGAFDPKLSGDWDVKNFKDTEYYNIFKSSIKIPTRLPIDPKFEINRNRGEFLNRENYISDKTDNVQFTAGVSIPIGSGLLTDSRRTAYNQAKVFQSSSQAEQAKMLNRLLLDATLDYWNWFYSYRQLALIQESLTIAEDIFSRVRIDFQYGEASVLDTVQADINIRNMSLRLQNAKNEWIEQSWLLSANLWDENENPVVIADSTIPEIWDEKTLDISNLNIESLLENASNHPELLKLKYKEQHLKLENKLNKENLKPSVNLNYNFINSPVNTEGEFSNPSFNSNYKFGLGFEFPLFLRKERAKIVKTDLKLLTNTYDWQNTERSILAKINIKYQQLLNSVEIVTQSEALAFNYSRLLNGELVNLETGESDLFKVNAQQEKYLEAQRKLLKNRALFQKNKAYLIYASGSNMYIYNQ